MTQPRIHRFDFSGLRDFRGPIVVNTAHTEELELIHVEPPPPVFTLADIEAARLAGKKEGYQEGFIAGEAEAKSRFDAKTESANDVIQAIADTVRMAHADYRKVLTKDAEHINALTLSVAKKIAGEALDERGEQAILAIIQDCMPVVFSKPRLTVELHPEMIERVVDRIETQIRTYDFEGEIQFRSNDKISISDVTLNWGSGEVRRDTSALWAELEGIISRIPMELTLDDTNKPETDVTGV